MDISYSNYNSPPDPLLTPNLNNQDPECSLKSTDLKESSVLESVLESASDKKYDLPEEENEVGSMSLGDSDNRRKVSVSYSSRSSVFFDDNGEFDESMERMQIDLASRNLRGARHKLALYELEGRAISMSSSSSEDQIDSVPSRASRVFNRIKKYGMAIGLTVSGLVISGLIIATSPLTSLALAAMHFSSKTRNQRELRSIEDELSGILATQALNESTRKDIGSVPLSQMHQFEAVSQSPTEASAELNDDIFAIHAQELDRNSVDQLNSNLEKRVLEARRNVLKVNLDKNKRNIGASLLFFVPVLGLLASGTYLRFANKEAKGIGSALMQAIIPETKAKLAQTIFYPLREFGERQQKIDEYQSAKDTAREITPAELQYLYRAENSLKIAKAKLLSFEADMSSGAALPNTIDLKTGHTNVEAWNSLKSLDIISFKRMIRDAKIGDEVDARRCFDLCHEYLKNRVKECRESLENFELYRSRFNHEPIKIPVNRADGQRHVLSAAIISAKIGYPVDYTQPIMVLFHANAQTLHGLWDRADFFRQQGFNVMTVTMGGYPGSDRDTKTTEASTYQDANAVIEYLKSVGAQNIGVYGVSIGGTLAFAAADLHPDVVKCVVADQTFDSAKNVAANLLGNAGYPRFLGRSAALAAFPAGEPVQGVYKNGMPYLTDGLDNAKKAAELKKTNCGVFVIKSDQDTFMGVDKRGDAFTDDLGKNLLKARYGKFEEGELVMNLHVDHAASFVDKADKREEAKLKLALQQHFFSEPKGELDSFPEPEEDARAYQV